jgi:hypothetical protein
MIRLSRPRHALLAGCVALLTILGLGGTAWAYFGSSGAGAGAASVGTLDAPSHVAAAQPDTGVPALRVTWTDSADPANAALDGYYVQSYVDGGTTPAAACGSSPTSLLPQGTTSCADSGRTVGRGYAYEVIAVYHSWSAASTISPAVTVSASILSGYSLSPSTATPVAGTAFILSITAVDQSGHPLTGYSGAQCLTLSGPAASPNTTSPLYPSAGTCASGSRVTFSAGAATADITLYDAQTVTLTASDNVSGDSGSLGLAVGPTAVARLSLGAATTTPTAGATDNLTITALDTYGNTATSYTGTHNLTFGGANAIGTYKPTVTNSSGTAVNFGSTTAITFSNGISSGAGDVMTLYKTGTANITATDGTITNGTGLAVTVSSTNWQMSWTLPLCPQFGKSGTTCTSSVTIVDQYGNAYAGPSVALALTLQGGGTHFSVTAGATGNSGQQTTATVSATSSPSGQFTVEHVDGSNNVNASLSVGGPTGFTPPPTTMPINS